jgi:hypothetical protein
MMCRNAFAVANEKAQQLCDVLRRQGSDKLLDMDAMAMRETIDIISKWGFGVDVGCLEVSWMSLGLVCECGRSATLLRRERGVCMAVRTCISLGVRQGCCPSVACSLRL